MKNISNKGRSTNIGKVSANSSVGRATRSNTQGEPIKSSAESSSISDGKRKAGYCQPTQSTLHRKAQVKTDKVEGTSGKDKSPGSAPLVHKASYNVLQEKPVAASRTTQKMAPVLQKKTITSTRIVRKAPVSEAKSTVATHLDRKAPVSKVKPTTSTYFAHESAISLAQKKSNSATGAVCKGASILDQKKPASATNITRKRSSPELLEETENSALPGSNEPFSVSCPLKKAKHPIDTPVISSSEETQNDSESVLPEPSRVVPRDLGPGFIQYFTPIELELYHMYHDADPKERQAMIDRGEVVAEDMARAYTLEHIFDHLPVPGKDFDPVTTETLPEMYLDPALRRLFLEEGSLKLKQSYMNHQSFSFEARNQVVEMMAQKLHSSCWRRDTFLLSVNLLDKVLAKGVVRAHELIIYALTCIFIATKLNEREPITVDELVTQLAEEVPITKMEKAESNILNFLKFDVYCIPTHQFLIRIGFYDKFNKHIITLAKYFLEISLFEIALVTELPSKLAAACYALSRRMLVSPEWTTGHHYYSGYTVDELEPVIETIMDTIDRLPMDSSISIRYNCTRHMFASHTAFSILCRDYDVVRGFRI